VKKTIKGGHRHTTYISYNPKMEDEKKGAEQQVWEGERTLLLKGRRVEEKRRGPLSKKSRGPRSGFELFACTVRGREGEALERKKRVNGFEET